jgi:hypothetical protein
MVPTSYPMGNPQPRTKQATPTPVVASILPFMAQMHRSLLFHRLNTNESCGGVGRRLRQ